MHTKEAEAALHAALAEAGITAADVRRVFVTHLHPDHLGMAGTLERAGAEVVMHGPELENAARMWSRDHSMIDETYAWFERHGMPAAVDAGMREAWLEIGKAVDEVERITAAGDGEELDLGGRRARIKWTPGHTDYHAVLVDEREGVLFSGDHVLPRITSNVGLYPYSRDDPLGDFLDALRAVRSLPVTRVLPAHGDPFDDLAGRVDQILAHHEERLRATLDALGVAERDAYAVCRALFPVLRSPHEERFALAETLAHLRYLERRGKVRELEGLPARWAVL
ncbi:MAG: MBL fold metallo-hydrolase [Chloroflexota bacterium]|nr:MBL fold metallo-hydrolase [Chloroflexota bacterium]